MATVLLPVPVLTVPGDTPASIVAGRRVELGPPTGIVLAPVEQHRPFPLRQGSNTIQQPDPAGQLPAG